MPALPAIKTGALRRLADELNFAPVAAARRHVVAAEALWSAVESDLTYPEDWIAAKITGFRPDVASPELVSGEALLADLGALVERLSVRAEFRSEELTDWLTVETLCDKWKITRRSLERYKRSGLISRRAKRSDHRTIVLYSPQSVERFEGKHSASLARARAFSRMSEEDRSRVIRRAKRYARLFRCSRAAAAKRIAPIVGRSAEAIRLLLAELDPSSPQSPFRPTDPIGPEGARFIARAQRRNIATKSIARKLGKSVAAVSRAGLLFRIHELLDTVSTDEAPAKRGTGLQETALLSHKQLTTGLGRPAAQSVPEAVAEALLAGWPEAAREGRLIEGYRLLSRRARATLQSLLDKPSATGFDAALTDLRWASRLKVELVRGEHMLLLKTVESQIAKPLLELDPAESASLYQECLQAIIESINRFDTTRGGRLASPAGLALSRAVTRWSQSRYTRRATGRATAMKVSSQALADWTRCVDGWQLITEPDPRLREGVAMLESADPKGADLLCRRFGWTSGGPPMTLKSIAEGESKPPATMARRERTAVIAALELWRDRHRDEKRGPTRGAS